MVFESPDAEKHGPDRHGWTILALTLVVVVRLFATAGDLALDEIWSLSFVKQSIHGFFECFALKHDNNHILNTIVMFSLGPDLPGICYRIPAAILSVLSVWIAGRIAMRFGGLPACVMAWILVGTSYLLILYSTEARGYSYLIFFAYLSWLFLLKTEATGRWTDAAVFSISASIGFLAHLTFLYCYAGFCIWTLRKFQTKRSWTLLFAHVLPCATAAWLFLFFIRGMEIGGGPDADIASAVASTLSIVMGGPLAGYGCWFFAATILLALAFGYFRCWQADRATAACYLTIIVLAPMVVLLKTRHSEIYPRYFLVPVAFALLVISNFVSKWWSAGLRGRIGQIAFVVVYIAGNSWWTERLLDHGRGEYSKALTWIGTQIHDGSATISTDHDFRNRKVFEYYANRLWPVNSPLVYVTLADRSREGTDWMILQNVEFEPPYPDQVKDPNGNSYRLQGVYRHQSLTGWNWWVYRQTSKAL